MAVSPPKPLLCMAVSPPKLYCHTFVSYFLGFQMSDAIPCVFLFFCNLAILLIFKCLFSWWNSFLWFIKLNVCLFKEPPFLHMFNICPGLGLLQPCPAKRDPRAWASVGKVTTPRPGTVKRNWYNISEPNLQHSVCCKFAFEKFGILGYPGPN